MKVVIDSAYAEDRAKRDRRQHDVQHANRCQKRRSGRPNASKEVNGKSHITTVDQQETHQKISNAKDKHQQSANDDAGRKTRNGNEQEALDLFGT
jgi:hypothetical protein